MGIFLTFCWLFLIGQSYFLAGWFRDLLMDLHEFSMIFDNFRHRDIAGRSKCLHDSSSRSGWQMTSGDPSLGNPSPKMRYIYIYGFIYIWIYVFFLMGYNMGLPRPRCFGCLNWVIMGMMFLVLPFSMWIHDSPLQILHSQGKYSIRD